MTEERHRTLVGEDTLYLRADMLDSASTIRYSYDEDDDKHWVATPFQAADASHDWATAFKLVRQWLKGQAG